MPEEKSVEFHAKKLKEATNLGMAMPHILKLVTIRTLEAVDALAEGMLHENKHVANHSIMSLGLIGGEDAIDSLISGLHYTDPPIAEPCAKALAKIGEPALPKVVKTIGRSSKFVNDRACDALKGMGEPAVKKLIELLNGEDQELMFKSAYALGLTQDERAVDPLIEHLQDEDATMAWRCIYALGKFKSKKAFDALVNALNDTDLVYASLKVLGERGDKAALPHLMKLSGHESYILNDAIKDAIKKIQEANRGKKR